jgi:hypothetical protein
MRIKRILSRVLPAALLAAGAFVALPGTPAQAKSDFTAKPFMGFSTWSVESSSHAGYGTNWLNEGNV